ncbi:MAG TPA: PHP domain-containing protein [Candidatus Pelethenecus faecipullorum]|uniref:PHP domain-containing protein n=1 Tax=Candidatus Pelethenecus faecipullorum TaxID=2840900 RepID=A0A9D1GQ32_9MOLU|nr:PHP domain-containing protein [Candidatus Pelethenecus faecipullorum]
MKIDLHNHTVYSDGILSCEELYERAVSAGVDVFALTDHDTVFGCEEMLLLDGKKKTRVILGLELSTVYQKESVHLVCLFKNNRIPKAMVDYSYFMIESRKKRAVRMMEQIQQIYHLKMNIEELLQESKTVTRANMMRHLAKYNAITPKEASFYVSKTSKAYLPSTEITTEEGIRLAKAANCIVILAHPCLLPRPIVEQIVQMGIDGLEVRYPDNREGDEAYFRHLAATHHLLCSAGSDCHGDSSHADIGSATLDETEFKPLSERIGFSYGD